MLCGDELEIVCFYFLEQSSTLSQQSFLGTVIIVAAQNIWLGASDYLGVIDISRLAFEELEKI